MKLFRCESCGKSITEGQPFWWDDDGIRWHKKCPPFTKPKKKKKRGGK